MKFCVFYVYLESLAGHAVILVIYFMQPSPANQELVDLEVSLIGSLCQFVNITPQDNEQHPVILCYNLCTKLLYNFCYKLLLFLEFL